MALATFMSPRQAANVAAPLQGWFLAWRGLNLRPPLQRCVFLPLHYPAAQINSATSQE